DSKTAAGGLGVVVESAANAANSGADLETAFAAAQAMRASMKMWFTISTLEYLRRGGRIGAANAWIGSALKIRPILTVETEITPVERVRTTKRAVARLVDHLRTRHESGCDVWLVQHLQQP